jgi:hypothetical protein
MVGKGCLGRGVGWEVGLDGRRAMLVEGLGREDWVFGEGTRGKDWPGRWRVKVGEMAG